MPRNHPAQILHKLRLGRLLGDMEQINGVYLRRFQHGIVAVNSSGGMKRIEIARMRMSKLQDVYEEKVIEVRGGRLPGEIPGQSGRLYGLFTT